MFYRLKRIVLKTPALAERPDDIPLLAKLFLRRAAPASRLAADACAWLAQRDWPGRVRALRAMVEAAAAQGTQSEAARLLGISRAGLIKKMGRLGFRRS